MNKDSYLVLDQLPPEYIFSSNISYIFDIYLLYYSFLRTSGSHFAYRYDSRVKAMEVDERPTEQYADIGGLDKQIQEVG